MVFLSVIECVVLRLGDLELLGDDLERLHDNLLLYLLRVELVKKDKEVLLVELEAVFDHLLDEVCTIRS